MELTLDQALQKGVEAHKAGNAQEADRYYTAILKANPKHPDANHNMGVLAVGFGKVEQALPFFKTALEVNQTIAQFWLSYIDALIKLDRIDDAKAVFDQAKSNGAKGNGFDQLEKRLAGIESTSNMPSNEQVPSQEQLKSLTNLYIQGLYQEALTQASQLLKQFPNSIDLYNILGAANQSLGKLDEAIEACTKAISLKPDFAEAYGNMGNAFKDQGKQEEAIQAYKKALSIKPDLAEAYNNMGVVLQEQGKLDEAIEAYNKALPNYVYAYNNLGNALKEQGKLDEAIEAYTKALSIKPDYAEAYNNMGNALKDQGKLEKAVEAYEKAILFKPNFAEAYNNVGNTFKEQGKLDEAIEAYKEALAIKPDYAEAWNNLYFPLQAKKLQLKSNKNVNALYPKDINSNYARIQMSILDYRLHRGQDGKGVYLDRAMKSLPSAENISIQNPIFDNNSNEEMEELPNKIVALVHFGRSGTGLLHSLIDGHPEVLTLPSIYFSEYFDHSTWIRIISDGWDKIVDHFISIYDVLFDASSSVPVESKGKQLKYNMGISMGMANVGNERDEILRVDKDLFRTELKRLLACYNQLDALIFFKLIHIAHERALNVHTTKNQIFYHIHNPDTYAQLNFAKFNPSTKWVMMVREPIQSCESWIRKNYQEYDYFGVASRIKHMLYEIDNIVYMRHQSVGVRLEDLKRRPRETIPALCKWMGIKEVESLYEMTAQGQKWWGDPSSRDYSNDGMKPFGKTSIRRKVGSIFSENDQFILRTLFYPFSVRFGYAKENEEQFKVDLRKIRPMIDEMFDFEKKIAEKMDMSFENFTNSGSYLYLRSCLIERWNTLNTLGTYPNMIVPLKIL